MECTTILVLGVPLFSVWGGIVKYILDTAANEQMWSLKPLIAQVITSGFTGCIAGLLSAEAQSPEYVTLALTGIAATLGCSLLKVFQNKFFPSLHRPTSEK